ncbi:MAG TPA: NADH-quinone oxidoreductase subunit M [Saprospiraceae bacterium]|nr:NADH-quinone oxidoreductase subunit M [Saprospiraceae bacterium]
MNILFVLLIPFLSALMILLASYKLSQSLAILSSAVSVVVIGVMLALFGQDTTAISSIDLPWIASMGVHFHIGADGMSLLMILICNVVALISMYVSLGDQIHNPKQYFALILFMQTFMNGVFVAQDLFLYYIFWELALIPAYFLLLIWGKGEKLRPATIKFFLFTLLGSLLMLIAIVWLGNAGATSDYSLSAITGLGIDTETQLMIFCAFMVAYGIKTPIFPLHSWQADTYTYAPAPVTILLSGVMSKMALYSIIRFVIPIVPDAVSNYGIYFMYAAAFGVLYASIIALTQKDFKRMLAYVSMAHVGLIFAGILTYSQAGLSGSMVQMVAHAINSAGLFFIANLLFKIKNTNDIQSFGGLRQYMPIFAGLYMVTMFGSIGVPMTNGFIGEFMILTSLYQYDVILALLAGSGVILGAVYMLRSYKTIMLGPDHSTVQTDISGTDKYLLYSIAFVILFTGIFPAWIGQLCETSIQNILQPYLQK